MRLSRLLEFAWPYRVSLALAVALALAETGAALLVPWLGGQFAGRMLAPGSQTGSTALLLFLLGVLAAQALLKFANAYLLSGTSSRILEDLRGQLYDHLQALPLSFYHGRRRGEVLALLTNDVTHLNLFLSGTLVSTLPMLATLAGALLLMIRIDVQLALVVSLLIPMMVAALKIAGRRLRPMSGALQDENAVLTALVEENIDKLPTIKAFAQEEAETARHRQQLARVRSLTIAQARIYSALEPAAQFAAAAAVVLMLWLGGSRLSADAMTAGELVSFLLYAALLTRPISALASLYGQTQMARGALERLERVLGEDVERQNAAGYQFVGARGAIAFEDVSFAYPGRRGTIEHASFTIAPGEIVALVGRNGAGKSTLVHLLMRLHEVASGRITLDGIDIASAELKSLRRQIGLVAQNVLLFNGSVSANISYGMPAAEMVAIEAAARAAQAHDFIMSLPDKYDTIIGDNGVRLSGGQRQRIALARALIKDPPILVLDEATAMFDPAGERAFVEDAGGVLKGRTVILITHRPQSLALAHRVLMLDGGRVTETGNPAATALG